MELQPGQQSERQEGPPREVLRVDASDLIRELKREESLRKKREWLEQRARAQAGGVVSAIAETTAAVAPQATDTERQQLEQNEGAARTVELRMEGQLRAISVIAAKEQEVLQKKKTLSRESSRVLISTQGRQYMVERAQKDLQKAKSELTDLIVRFLEEEALMKREKSTDILDSARIGVRIEKPMITDEPDKLQQVYTEVRETYKDDYKKHLQEKAVEFKEDAKKRQKELLESDANEAIKASFLGRNLKRLGIGLVAIGALGAVSQFYKGDNEPNLFEQVMGADVRATQASDVDIFQHEFENGGAAVKLDTYEYKGKILPNAWIVTESGGNPAAVNKGEDNDYAAFGVQQLSFFNSSRKKGEVIVSTHNIDRFFEYAHEKNIDLADLEATYSACKQRFSKRIEDQTQTFKPFMDKWKEVARSTRQEEFKAFQYDFMNNRFLGDYIQKFEKEKQISISQFSPVEIDAILGTFNQYGYGFNNAIAEVFSDPRLMTPEQRLTALYNKKFETATTSFPGRTSKLYESYKNAWSKQYKIYQYILEGKLKPGDEITFSGKDIIVNGSLEAPQRPMGSVDTDVAPASAQTSSVAETHTVSAGSASSDSKSTVVPVTFTPKPDTQTAGAAPAQEQPPMSKFTVDHVLDNEITKGLTPEKRLELLRNALNTYASKEYPKNDAGKTKYTIKLEDGNVIKAYKGTKLEKNPIILTSNNIEAWGKHVAFMEEPEIKMLSGEIQREKNASAKQALEKELAEKYRTYMGSDLAKINPPANTQNI